jgi:hypothetical protein
VGAMDVVEGVEEMEQGQQRLSSGLWASPYGKYLNYLKWMLVRSVCDALEPQ